VSCYAFIIGWLLPSLPSGCFQTPTSFNLCIFGVLSCQSGLFPSRLRTLAPRVCLLTAGISVFEVFNNLVGKLNPRIKKVLYPRFRNKHSTKIDFAENQLSLSLIGLSPLTTNHPSIFRHTRVRPSKKRCRFIFSLFMVRSPSFGFYIEDLVIGNVETIPHLLPLLRLHLAV
jgi:hypothetical protein